MIGKRLSQIPMTHEIVQIAKELTKEIFDASYDYYCFAFCAEKLIRPSQFEV